MGDYSASCHVKSSPQSRPSLFNQKYHDDLYTLNGEWNNNSSIEFGMVSKGERLALKYCTYVQELSFNSLCFSLFISYPHSMHL
jgi:hypothetical protein